MRIVGITFLLVTVAGVILPDPLGWYLLAPVAVASGMALVVEYADRKVQRSLNAAAETAGHQEWTGQLKQMEVDDDEAWKRLQDAITAHPAPLVFPGQLRSVRIPQPRRPHSAS